MHTKVIFLCTRTSTDIEFFHQTENGQVYMTSLQTISDELSITCTRAISEDGLTLTANYEGENDWVEEMKNRIQIEMPDFINDRDFYHILNDIVMTRETLVDGVQLSPPEAILP